MRFTLAQILTEEDIDFCECRFNEFLTKMNVKTEKEADRFLPAFLAGVHTAFQLALNRRSKL